MRRLDLKPRLSILAIPLCVFAAAFFYVGEIAAAVSGAPPTSSTGETIGEPVYFWMMVLYASIALVFSFLCSVAEAVVLSVSPSYIANLEAEGSRSAKVIANVKGNIDRSLAAILTLNTIAHTVGAGGAGAQAAQYYGQDSIGVSMAVLTLLILFLSEIIPKTLGALYWRALAPATARFVQVLTWILYPLIFVSELLTRLIARGKSVHVISREELAAMADVGEAAGQLDQLESRILKNVFLLPGLRAEDVMTPRTVVFALQEDLSVADALAAHDEIEFSRIPIYAANRDEVTGFVLKTDLLLNQYTRDGKSKLRDLKHTLQSIPSGAPLSLVLEELLETRVHILLVVDEYGGMDGLITLEDLVETLIGMEIVDESDKVEDMRHRAREKWKKRMEKMGIDPQDFDTPEKS